MIRLQFEGGHYLRAGTINFNVPGEATTIQVRVGSCMLQFAAWASMEVQSIVRGRHVYKRIWTPVTGEELTVIPEDDRLMTTMLWSNYDAWVSAVVIQGWLLFSSAMAIVRVLYYSMCGYYSRKYSICTRHYHWLTSKLQRTLYLSFVHERFVYTKSHSQTSWLVMSVPSKHTVQRYTCTCMFTG